MVTTPSVCGVLISDGSWRLDLPWLEVLALNDTQGETAQSAKNLTSIGFRHWHPFSAYLHSKLVSQIFILLKMINARLVSIQIRNWTSWSIGWNDDDVGRSKCDNAATIAELLRFCVGISDVTIRNDRKLIYGDWPIPTSFSIVRCPVGLLWSIIALWRKMLE